MFVKLSNVFYTVKAFRILILNLTFNQFIF